MLKDDSVPAADAGVLSHVDDPQAPVGLADVAILEPRAPALPEQPLGRQFTVPLHHPARLGLQMGQRRERAVVDAPALIPRTQAPVSVLEGHAVGLVEPSTDRL